VVASMAAVQLVAAPELKQAGAGRLREWPLDKA
jgi:hypothetical protein